VKPTKILGLAIPESGVGYLRPACYQSTDDAK